MAALLDIGDISLLFPFLLLFALIVAALAARGWSPLGGLLRKFRGGRA